MDRNQPAKRNEFVPLAKFKTYKLKNYNFLLVIFLIVLSALGIAVVGSASGTTSAMYKQGLGIAIGFVGMIIISLIDYNWLLKFHWFYYVINIGLLLLVLFKGKNLNGATRWIPIGDMTLQPSEFAKIFLIVFMAKFLTAYKERVSKFSFLFLFGTIVAIPILLILKEPDLSTSIVIIMLFIVAVYVAGLSYKKLLLILGITIPIAVAALIYIQQPDQKLLKPYQLRRVLSFIYPDEYDDLRYQQDNSVLAIGSGQLNGKGLNNDRNDSVKNGNYLSKEAVNDFIFAVIGEELGFVGGAFILLLLFLIVAECFISAILAPDLSGRLICINMAMLIAFQTFVNVGVATEILPNTGIPLPFVSSGLSSVLAYFGGMGFVLNVSLQKVKQQY